MTLNDPYNLVFKVTPLFNTGDSNTDRREIVKISCSTPKRYYPAWIRVCWCIACQNRFNGL